MTHDQLLEQLGDARRIIIVGGPGTGKSSLAKRITDRYLERKAQLPALEQLTLEPLWLLATDALIQTHDWSECSAIAADWISREGGYVIEGVATARAIRKWLAANPGAALDAVIVLTGQPFVEVSKGQAAMNKGVSTVWNQIAIEVLQRGARVINAASPEPIRESSEGPQAPPA